MGRKCIIPGCKSGYTSNLERVSLFCVPKDDDLRSKWISMIPPTRVPVTSSHFICEKHFLDTDIERQFIHRDSNGKIIANVAYLHPRLKKTAIPTIFESKRRVDFPKDISIVCNSSVVQSASHNDKRNYIATCENLLMKTDAVLSLTIGNSAMSLSQPEDIQENIFNEQDIINENDYGNSKVNSECKNKVFHPEPQVEVSSSLKEAFADLFNNADAINIPLGWFRYTSSNSQKWIAFSMFEKKQTEPNLVQPLPRKSIIILECGNVYASANGKTIHPTNICRSLESIDNVEHLSRFLSTFATVGLCSGVQPADDSFSQFRVLFKDPFGQGRHKECSIVSNKRTCDVCRKLKRSLTQKKRRTNHNSQPKRIILPHKNLQENLKIIALRKRLRSQKESIRRARGRVKKLKGVLFRVEERIRHLDDQSIADKCAELNLPNAQQLCIKEIVSAARAKNSHGHRFTENWLMLCMFMHIRLPAYYRFLLRNEILPLPTPRTIRRYFSIINTKCSFDDKFFERFRKRLEGKPSMEKHGILLLDEISQWK